MSAAERKDDNSGGDDGKLNIATLEDETERLLNDIRKYQQKNNRTPFKASKAVDREKTSKQQQKENPTNAPLPSPKKVRDDSSGMQTPSRSAQKSKKGTGGALSNLLSQSADVPSLRRTAELFNPSASRVTVEVLDDASPDHTPREGYVSLGKSGTGEEGASKSQSISKGIQAIQTEAAVRDQVFDAERSRLSAEMDTFVPGPGVTTADVQKERDRLQNIENSARMKFYKVRKQATDRRAFLVQDNAATKVQKIIRGHFGRLKFAIEKKLTTMLEENYSNDWLEVRDRETGDVWYYNQKTGESQWDRPDELFDFHADNTVAKALPDQSADSSESLYGSSFLPKHVRSAIKAGGVPSLETLMEGKSDKVAHYPQNKSHMSVEEKRQGDETKNEIFKELGIDRTLTRDKLTSFDGSFRPNLRETVQTILGITRFDTVSSVLQDDRWMDSEKAGANIDTPQHKSLSLSVDTEEKVDLSRKPLVSVPKFSPKKTPGKGKVISLEDKPLTRHDMTLKAIEYSGLSLDDLSTSPDKDGGKGKEVEIDQYERSEFMCFGCWSAGSKRVCDLHESGEKLKPSETMLLCRNWELAIMRRRYRSEEIQEIFLKKSTSIRYDVKRKKFLTVEEQRHIIYRFMTLLMDAENLRMNIIIKGKRWMMSLIDVVRCGKVKSMKQSVRDQAAIMKLRRTVDNNTIVNAFSRKVAQFFPLPPTTGYSWPERIGTEKYLFTLPNPSLGTDCEMILIEPIPVPKHLYLPREYHLPVVKNVPMPKPSYKDLTHENLIAPNKYIDDMSNIAWFERICHSNVNNAFDAAVAQVKYVSPIPGLEKLRREKQPPPCSVKFATIGRKPTPQNMDIGGLPVELLIYQMITTFYPAQYGSLMVMDKSVISPGLSPEAMITFESVMIPPLKSGYTLRPVEHPLIYRRVPTIACHSKVELEGTKHFYGKNRPEQTGEVESYGFRTNSFATNVLILGETDPQSFTPGVEIASLNNPVSNKSNTTHVDLSYPFCDPSSRDNTTLDFFSLLLQGIQSISTSQIFTALSIQEPGFFLKDGDLDKPMGHLVVSTYRSWAFAQSDYIEEFKTDEGISYWFHRKTGQTFWERPLYEQEELHPLKGGTELDMDHREEPLVFAKGDPDNPDSLQFRYTQGDFRKNQMRHHESDGEAKTRRSYAANSASLMRVRGNLPKDPTKWTEKPKEEKLMELDFRDEDQKSDNSTMSVQSVSSSQAGTTTSQGYPQKGAANEVKPFGVSIKTGDQYNPKSTTDIFEEVVQDTSHIIPNAGLSEANLAKNKVASFAANPADSQVFKGLAQTGINPDLMTALSAQITSMMASVMDQGNSNEMIQMGLGMGMALMQSANLLGLVDGIVNPESPKVLKEEYDYTKVDREKGLMPDTSIEAVQARMNADSLAALEGKEPIGKVNATVRINQQKTLNREEADKQKKDLISKKNTTITSEDKARHITIQPESLEATPTPDVRPPKVLTNYQPKDAEEKMKDEVPVLIYPELSTCLPDGMTPSGSYRTHPVAGLGTSFVLESDHDKQAFVQGTVRGQVLRKTVMPLPVGFFNAISKRHIATQEVDYLPQVPNLPQPRVVGRVKPRSCALDWLAIAFDPWSAGMDPLGNQRVESLAAIADHIFGGPGMKPGKGVEKMEDMKAKVTADAFATVEDLDGQSKKKAEITKADMIAKDFHKVCQLVRHNKVDEVEDLINQLEWAVPIDYQDSLGNSLIHVAAQNGNKRLIKLILRRGGEANAANLSGQTPLHYLFGYGYDEVGNYLIKRGADDSIRNKDGLTCYEGLGARELSLL